MGHKGSKHVKLEPGSTEATELEKLRQGMTTPFDINCEEHAVMLQRWLSLLLPSRSLPPRSTQSRRRRPASRFSARLWDAAYAGKVGCLPARRCPSCLAPHAALSACGLGFGTPRVCAHRRRVRGCAQLPFVPKGDGWKKMGFQGADPATDTRAAGCVARPQAAPPPLPCSPVHCQVARRWRSAV